MSTIGVAIAIPEPWATDLQAQRASFGDPQASAIPTHITLVPPTDVGDELDAVEQHLTEVATQQSSFRLRLRGTATFRPVSPVVFVNLVEGISPTEQLAKDCRRGPLELQLDFPYHPHVTVAHVDDDDLLDRAFDELATFDCSFTVDAFHLYVHDPDLGWKATHDYALTGDER